MEVGIPAPFHFDNLTTTAFLSTPSTPPRHFDSDSSLEFYHRYTSAPSSPTAVSNFYATFRRTLFAAENPSSYTFDWEEKPSTPKSYGSDCVGNTDESEDSDYDFAFQVSGRHLGKGPPPALPPLTHAEELFELGMIRPLKLPPRLYTPVMGDRSPKSPRNRGGLLSPLRRGRGLGRCEKEFDPFAVAMAEATKDRRKDTHSISNSRSRKGSRSLSPCRGSGTGGFFHTPNSFQPQPPTLTNDSCKNKGSIGRGRKWCLKNLLLFWSSSELQTTRDGSKDPLCNYPSSSSTSSPSLQSQKKKKGFSVKSSRNSSFRSSDSGSMQRGAVTPHEMHDATESAVETTDVMTKAPLLQRQGLFKRLRIKAANRVFVGGQR